MLSGWDKHKRKDAQEEKEKEKEEKDWQETLWNKHYVASTHKY